jgi:hypothetical protein
MRHFTVRDDAPTIEQVKELRERANRYRLRLRETEAVVQSRDIRIGDLEKALIAKAMHIEAIANGLDDGKNIPLQGVFVDDRGQVIGAKAAVLRFVNS